MGRHVEAKPKHLVLASECNERGNRALRVTQVVDCHARAACSQGQNNIGGATLVALWLMGDMHLMCD